MKKRRNINEIRYMNKIRYIITSLVFCIIVGGFSAWLLIKSPDESSDWERRPLAQFPEASYETLTDRKFMDGFESYVNDQFPLRNTFRRIKAMIHFNVYNQMDNNGIYVVDGHASEYKSEITDSKIDTFNDRINSIYSDFLKNTGCKVYYSIIPDKNYFLAEENGYPSFDYEYLYSRLGEGMDPAIKEIVIRDKLTIDDYYTTDTHWRQEQIVDIANYIRGEMGMEAVNGYTQQSAGDFYGVYYGQSALNLDPDEIIYLENEQIKASSVYNLEVNETVPVYNLSKLDGKDHYDIYLSGATAFLTITNPMGEEGKKLVVFRDSFGSSLTPLLMSGYSEITVVDTRYMYPRALSMIDFTDQDVLFVYSTLVVEQSAALRK